MITATRTREYREGVLRRFRTYRCRRCGQRFQVDTLKPLPLNARLCEGCRPPVEAESGKGGEMGKTNPYVPKDGEVILPIEIRLSLQDYRKVLTDVWETGYQEGILAQMKRQLNQKQEY